MSILLSLPSSRSGSPQHWIGEGQRRLSRSLVEKKKRKKSQAHVVVGLQALQAQSDHSAPRPCSKVVVVGDWRFQPSNHLSHALGWSSLLSYYPSHNALAAWPASNVQATPASRGAASRPLWRLRQENAAEPAVKVVSRGCASPPPQTASPT